MALSFLVAKKPPPELVRDLLGEGRGEISSFLGEWWKREANERLRPSRLSPCVCIDVHVC